MLLTPKGEDLPFGIEDSVTDLIVADQKDEKIIARISSDSISIFPTSEEVLQDIPRLATRPRRSYQSRVQRLRVVVKVRLHHTIAIPLIAIVQLLSYPRSLVCRSNICTLRM